MQAQSLLITSLNCIVSLNYPLFTIPHSPIYGSASDPASQ
jgi:hypothetical protein